MSRSDVFAAVPPMPQEQRQRIFWAYDLGENFHRGQFRDDGDRYWSHCVAVMNILVEHGYTSYEYLVTALLHDAFEDTYLTPSLTERVFGPDIARGLIAVSKSYGVEDPINGRIHRLPNKTKEEYFKEITRFGRRAAIAKCADRIHNLSDLVGPQPEDSRWTPAKRLAQVAETREWILPLAEMYEPRFAAKLQELCVRIEANVATETTHG